jgi:hypothetical protein
MSSAYGASGMSSRAMFRLRDRSILPVLLPPG